MNQLAKPTVFRIVLIVVVILTACIGVGLFAFGHQSLAKFAEETRAINTEAQASDNELQALSSLKAYLDRSSSDVDRAAQIASISRSYTYQDQIVADIIKHGNASGIQVSTVDFSTESTQSSNSSASSTTTNTKATIPSGFKSVTAKVTLDTPVPYDRVYNLVSRLENSLFRMQISSLQLSRDKDTGGVSVNTLTLEVYTK